MEAFDSLSSSHKGSKKSHKSSSKDSGSRHKRKKSDTDDLSLLLSKSSDHDPTVPTVDYSQILTKPPDVPSNNGSNPFGDEPDMPTRDDKRKRRSSISMHRSPVADSSSAGSSTPSSPHRRSESFSGTNPPMGKAYDEAERARSSSTSVNRMNRSPSTPTVGSGNSKNQVHEAQLSGNFTPGIPSNLSPRSQLQQIERPDNVPVLTNDTDDRKFSKRNIYFNLAAQNQALVTNAQETIVAELTEKLKLHESFIRAINQRQQVMMALLSDISHHKIIQLDSRGQYIGSFDPPPDECCNCGCFSFCFSFFDTA